MRRDPRHEGAVHRVSDSEVFAGRLHYWRERSVVDVANSWKKMVFYLKVKTTDKPRQKAIIRCKIDRRLNLMHSERTVHSTGILFRHWKLSFLNAVRQLEDDA